MTHCPKCGQWVGGSGKIHDLLAHVESDDVADVIPIETAKSYVPRSFTKGRRR